MSMRISSPTASFPFVHPRSVEGRALRKTAFDKLGPNGAWLFPLLMLAACGQSPGDRRAAGSDREAAIQDDANRIYCAVNGAQAMTRECTAEREKREGGIVVTVRNPDGGFHRFAVSADDHDVLAADGAEPAMMRTLEKQGKTTVEVSIGGDRYQLPGWIEGRLPDAL